MWELGYPDPPTEQQLPQSLTHLYLPTPGLGGSSELGSEIQFPRFSKKGSIEASPTWKVPQF